eukprot:scaffold1401_cov330-Pavlova_lutheri.AAC.63
MPHPVFRYVLTIGFGVRHCLLQVQGPLGPEFSPNPSTFFQGQDALSKQKSLPNAYPMKHPFDWGDDRGYTQGSERDFPGVILG